MPRPTTKNDLMTAAKENYEKLYVNDTEIYFLCHGDNFLKQ